MESIFGALKIGAKSSDDLSLASFNSSLPRAFHRSPRRLLRCSPQPPQKLRHSMKNHENQLKINEFVQKEMKKRKEFNRTHVELKHCISHLDAGVAAASDANRHGADHRTNHGHDLRRRLLVLSETCEERCKDFT